MKINNKYDILTPNGFEHFEGVQKLRKKTIEVFFDNGISLRGSYNHSVFDFDGSPTLLSKIKIGSKIKSHDGCLSVTKIKKYYYKTNVFDIVNSGIDHIFFSNDILSHNCDFLGSGDGVISGDIQANISKNLIRVPIEKYMQGNLWQWKEPIVGHRYIAAIDVSRGDSEDSSSISIIDFDEGEQVVEYIGKIPPDDLALVAYKWAILYSAFIVVDITGGMGVATSRKLQELNYKNMYVEGINTQNIWDYNKNAVDKIPGLNFNNKRVQIVASFEEHLRKGFGVRSSRLLNELSSFVYINGRPDHMKGAHDDAIMGLAMALYVGDMCFKQLERSDSQSKAMVNSWVMSERTYEVNKSFYSYGTTFDPIGSIQVDQSLYHGQNPMSQPKTAYSEYSWLFGKPKNHLK